MKKYLGALVHCLVGFEAKAPLSPTRQPYNVTKTGSVFFYAAKKNLAKCTSSQIFTSAINTKRVGGLAWLLNSSLCSTD